MFNLLQGGRRAAETKRTRTVIVCGAGQVGTTIARHLAGEGMAVTVVDSSPDEARRVDEAYDVRGIAGHASHPETLERAGAADADMLIAVTKSDEINMVACQVAYSLFDVPRRIARLRHGGYLGAGASRLYGNAQCPIDVVISPEIEIAQGISRRLRMPGAFDSQALADGRVHLFGVHCDAADCGLVGRRLGELTELLPGIGLMVVALLRDGKPRMPRADETVALGDDLYIVARTRDVPAAMAFLGHRETVARRVLLVGGGSIGLTLAKSLVAEGLCSSLKIIENDAARAAHISRELGPRVLVFKGDALDQGVLREAGAGLAQTVVAMTDDDETNIFTSVLSKREGCKRAIAIVNKTSYQGLIPTLGIDSVVHPDSVSISSILRHVRHRSVSSVYAFREDFGEIVEATAQEGSGLVSGPLRRVVPEGMLVAAVMRADHAVVPHADFTVAPGDRVVLMVSYAALKAAETVMAPGRAA